MTQVYLNIQNKKASKNNLIIKVFWFLACCIMTKFFKYCVNWGFQCNYNQFFMISRDSNILHANLKKIACITDKLH